MGVFGKMSHLTDYFKDLCMYSHLWSLMNDQITILRCPHVGIFSPMASSSIGRQLGWAGTNILSGCISESIPVRCKDVDTW